MHGYRTKLFRLSSRVSPRNRHGITVAPSALVDEYPKPRTDLLQNVAAIAGQGQAINVDDVPLIIMEWTATYIPGPPCSLTSQRHASFALPLVLVRLQRMRCIRAEQ